MKNFLKISLFGIFIGFVMIILFSIKSEDSFISVLNKIIISQYGSGIYSDEDISFLNIESVVSKDTENFFIIGDDIEIESSDNVENIKVQYYNLPNVRVELNQSTANSYMIRFNYTKFEIVFNKKIQDYKKVKVLVPKNSKYIIFTVVARELKLDGINAGRMNIWANGVGAGNINISNISADDFSLLSYDKVVNIKNSNIKTFKNDLNSNNVNLENVNGNKFIIGDKASFVNMNEYNNHPAVNVTLNNSFFEDQEYYGRELNVNINNNIDINNYYFNINSKNGVNKINGKEYNSIYETNNLNSSKYKIRAGTKNLNLKIN